MVLECHDSLRKEIRDAREELNEKHDLTAFQLKALNKKLDDKTEELRKRIDAIAVDLTAHRADTEKHKMEYKVSE